jgi:hypothetical protein
MRRPWPALGCCARERDVRERERQGDGQEISDIQKQITGNKFAENILNAGKYIQANYQRTRKLEVPPLY